MAYKGEGEVEIYYYIYNKTAKAFLKCKHFQKVGDVSKACRPRTEVFSFCASHTSIYAVAGQNASHVPLTTSFAYITYFLEMLAFQESFCRFIIKKQHIYTVQVHGSLEYSLDCHLECVQFQVRRSQAVVVRSTG
jgi:hypothetical protein